MLAFPQKPEEQSDSFLFCLGTLIPASVMRYRREKRGRGLTWPQIGSGELWSLPSHQRCKTAPTLFTASVSRINK